MLRPYEKHHRILTSCRMRHLGRIILDIKSIRDAVEKQNHRFSNHAIERMAERKITRQEIEQVITRGEIIEEYPEDKYGPSCLIYGDTDIGRPLHVQISLPPKVKVITTYEPNPQEWENYRVRKTNAQ
jgi:hypothetical protein